MLVGCRVVDESPLPVPAQSEYLAYFPLVANDYPRKPSGISGAMWGLDPDWYYYWSVAPSVTNDKLVRMVWCLSDYHLAVYTPKVIAAATVDHRIGAQRTWLIMNEPDDTRHTISGGQCGAYPITGNPLTSTAPRVHTVPARMAVRYSAMYDLIKAHDPNAQVFPAGLSQLGTQHGREWWTVFVETLAARGELWKIDGVHVHAYPCWTTGHCAGWGMSELFAALDEWYTDYHAGLGLGDKPLWLTEVGAGPFCEDYAPFDRQAWIDVRDNVMIPFQDWQQVSPYTTAAWFVSWDGLASAWTCNYLVDARDGLTITPLGEQWGTR